MMSSKGRKKPSLQDLIRQSGDIKSQFEELQGDSDRACALVAAAIVADNLKDLLEAHFTDSVILDSTDIDRLFYGQNAVLSTLANRADIALAFGIIDKSALDVITAIRHVRNSFAHAPTQFSFSHEVIKAEIEKVINFLAFDTGQFDSKKQFALLTAQLVILLKELTTKQYKHRAKRLRSAVDEEHSTPPS
jgi:hypothetical protein